MAVFHLVAFLSLGWLSVSPVIILPAAVLASTLSVYGYWLARLRHMVSDRSAPYIVLLGLLSGLASLALCVGAYAFGRLLT